MSTPALTATALAGLMLATTAPPALAQACGPREALIDRLQGEYAETLSAAGLQAGASESLMEIWSSPDSGSFTVLITTPQGTSCVVASGTDFFTVAPDEIIPGELG